MPQSPSITRQNPLPAARLRPVALAGMLAVLISTASQAALPTGASAQIISLQGAGDQRAAAASDWQPAHAAQALVAGDYVRTRQAARMALVFADETQLRLHQNTVLQVKAVAQAGQTTTTLRLEAGRAWTQTRRPPGSPLELQTPAATAAIRGTDWDISVEPDGRTLITVLSGTVDFGNAQGQVSVGPNEAALAEVGKAPVKLVLSQPRDRVQWVNALQADPAAHLRAAPPPDGLLPVLDALAQRKPQAARQALAQAGPGTPPAWRATLQAATDLQAGDGAAARAALERLATQADAPLAVWLMQSDLQLMDGESETALATLRQALARWPAHPALLAQQARVQLLMDRLDAAHATLAIAPQDPSAELALVRAALARREGQATATLAAYADAAARAPQDARAWLGLGSAQAERENTQPARQHLAQALQLDPHLPGAQGERGTLETFSNRFADADAAFAQALQDNPADYVALAGLGLLRLKQGQPEAALDAFLRAGVMEPRYARAKTWTAVAYYQLGRHQDAMATLQQASQLDDKDPIPWMLLAQIHTDRFEAGEAVQAAREALVRMPYLKSLNQLANDQKGSANLGAALAFFGMEEWALELAQQSFSPYWGASHLFLADRYPGEFNKNSALYQGFLTDPMAFGASQRHSDLLQRPGVHGVAEVQADKEFYRASAPSVTLNGMDNRHVPLAWFVKAQTLSMHDYPIDIGVVDYPALRIQDSGFSGDARVLTLGLGAQPSERLNLFAYANRFDMDMRGNNNLETVLDHTNTQGVLGASWRWGPAEQTWLKLGRNLEQTRSTDYPSFFVVPPMWGMASLSSESHKTLSDVQLRHSVDPAPGTRLGAALEHVREKQGNLTTGNGLVSAIQPEVLDYSDLMAFGAYNQIDRRYTAVTLDGQHQWSPALRLDAALGLQQIRHRVDGVTGTLLVNADYTHGEQAQRHDTERAATPRVGAVWQPAPGHTLRMAYQDWMRPLSISTLTRVETAGIPVEDRLLEAGGRHKRTAVQWTQPWGASTFVGLRADHLRATNPDSVGVDMRTPKLPFLEEMRNAQMVNLSAADLLEDTPSFQKATVNSLVGSVNHMLSRRWSVYGKYFYQHSRSTYTNASKATEEGLMVPYMPKHTLALGATWVSTQRWYVSGRAVYRSLRYEDAINLTPRPAGWTMDLVSFWESQDKRWLVGAGILNLWGPKSDRQKTRYIVDVRYRF